MASQRTDIGREDNFLSEHQRYEFRFVTTALSWTNNLEKSTGHNKFNNPASKHAPLYRFTAALADLLVRHLEIVAVTASDEKNVLAVYDNSGEAELDPQEDEEVNVTQNLQDLNRGTESGDKGKHSPLNINSTSTAADAPSTSAGGWLLRVTLAHPVAQKFPKTNVTFGRHFTNIVKLAQATYTAGDKKAARNLLNDYILLSSSAKIMGRIRKGMPKSRNLYEFLTKPGSDLMHGLQKTELDFSTILRIVAGEDTLGKTLTRREQSVIKETMQLLKVKSEANLGVPTNYDAKVVVKTKTLYEPMSKIADEFAINDAMSYNKQTAEFLQSMLSAVLINVKGSFKALTFAKRQAQLYKAGNYDLALANDPVSKRCCPACHALVRYLVTYHKCNLMYAGNHAVWFAAALPPWIPKPAGLYVLAEARMALSHRFQYILNGETAPSGSEDSWKTDETSHHFSTSLPQIGAYSSPRLPTVVEGWIYPDRKARAKCYDCNGRIAGI